MNLEHVVSLSTWSEQVFYELFVDTLYQFHNGQGSMRSRSEIAHEYYHCPGQEANLTASVETQCNWLRETGFVDVGGVLKLFEIALFGGRDLHERPKKLSDETSS